MSEKISLQNSDNQFLEQTSDTYSKAQQTISLKKYFDEAVIIYGTNGGRVVGIVEDYISPKDSALGIESIIVNSNGTLYEFVEEDIDKIEIL